MGFAYAYSVEGEGRSILYMDQHMDKLAGGLKVIQRMQLSNNAKKLSCH